ncbi:PREDICTED: uncharacterized protein LOC107168980 [Diuraphis noxia]|uniref:uncharacterized protein LOC107168980 n=1 Tax=Diuraphis noxia TaxID=143948 RepID=UPI000763A3A1|nr:PREDICTED: uncharacterized protein LOC107168980 [Diuraphis noxia]
MSSNCPSTFERLLTALNCMLNDGFAIQDKTLLEKLLTSLQNADALLSTVPINVHCKWFASVLEIYQNQTPISRNACIHLYAFALKYLAILVKHDNGLDAFIETHTLQSMINQLDVTSNLKESSIFNAYMSLLQSLNTHKRGLEYVFQEGLWKIILFSIHGLTVPAKYVEIQASQYIADLIYKSFDYEMAHYCEPLLEELFNNLNSTDNLTANHQDIKEFVGYNVYVKTLILSLEKFIGTKYESDVVCKIINKYSLSDVLVNIQKLLNVNPILLKNYITLHLIFDCLTVWHNSDMEYVLKSIFYHMNNPKNIHSYKKINNLCTQAIKYANTSNAQLTANPVFEKELIIGQLIPLNKCSDWILCSKHKKSKYDRSCIIESKYILNYCSNYDSMINEVAISSILNIVDIIPILKQMSLDYLFNFFSTLTERFFNSDNWLEQCQSRDSIYNKFLEILSYIFICWAKVIECKLFTETTTHNELLVSLVQSLSQFLHKPSHNSTLLQNGLKLISTALNNMDKENVQYTGNLENFGTLCTTLHNLLLDTRPEIRDSSLQCITSIVNVSKYSSGNFFIKIILEKHLSIAVMNTLKHDNDPFVRSKALECLEKMVSVLDIWETSLKESDLITHCLNLMQYESEGIIRRQIVKLLTALFINNELSDNLFNEICIVMVHISIKDPLWEVKTFTYEFWSSVVYKFIGKCCKQNNTERLNDNLVKLSSTGCLHVLYVALKEEHDLVVQKKAICLAKELIATINSIDDNMQDLNVKLKRKPVNCLHNIIDESIENCSGSINKKSRQLDSADRILSSITISSDSELLPSLKSFNNSNIYPNNICLRQKTDIYIKIDDFLNFTSIYDFNDCDTKTQWVISTRSGLDSMLDDIIDQSQNCFIEGADLLDCH